MIISLRIFRISGKVFRVQYYCACVLVKNVIIIRRKSLTTNGTPLIVPFFMSGQLSEEKTVLCVLTGRHTVHFIKWSSTVIFNMIHTYIDITLYPRFFESFKWICMLKVVAVKRYKFQYHCLVSSSPNLEWPFSWIIFQLNVPRTMHATYIDRQLNCGMCPFPWKKGSLPISFFISLNNMWSHFVPTLAIDNWPNIYNLTNG